MPIVNRRIVVDPEGLREAAGLLREKQEQLAALEKDLVASAADAPSYEGQFGSQVSAMASEGSASLRAVSADVGRAIEELERIADNFEAADQETQEQLAQFSTGILSNLDGLMALIGASGDGQILGGALQTAGGHVADFFIGMWEEGKDMVTGLYNLVTDPIGTAKGLWYGLTHPAELWEAFKQPYVEAWESGHPGQAIGRGVMFVGSIVLGTKGIDKAAKAVKAIRAARVSAEAAETGARAGSALNAAREIGAVARGSGVETALARYIATESTQTFGTVDRIVIGAFEANPARGFLGYVDEAATRGGSVYNTTREVWDFIKPAGSNRGWAVNREFMQAQIERGVPRIELRGETVSEVMNNAWRLESGTAKEISFLQRYGYEYGYRKVGDSWLKVGEWRAGTEGWAAGGSIGPTLDVLEDAHP